MLSRFTLTALVLATSFVGASNPFTGKEQEKTTHIAITPENFSNFKEDRFDTLSHLKDQFEKFEKSDPFTKKAWQPKTSATQEFFRAREANDEKKILDTLNDTHAESNAIKSSQAFYAATPPTDNTPPHNTQN